MVRAWGCERSMIGQPLCLHCRSFGLHRWCRCVLRVEAHENPGRYVDLFQAKKRGRASSRVVAAREKAAGRHGGALVKKLTVTKKRLTKRPAAAVGE